jgi:hypothetical protein
VGTGYAVSSGRRAGVRGSHPNPPASGQHYATLSVSSNEEGSNGGGSETQASCSRLRGSSSSRGRRVAAARRGASEAGSSCSGCPYAGDPRRHEWGRTWRRVLRSCSQKRVARGDGLEATEVGERTLALDQHDGLVVCRGVTQQLGQKRFDQLRSLLLEQRAHLRRRDLAPYRAVHESHRDAIGRTRNRAPGTHGACGELQAR